MQTSWKIAETHHNATIGSNNTFTVYTCMWRSLSASSHKTGHQHTPTACCPKCMHIWINTPMKKNISTILQVQLAIHTLSEHLWWAPSHLSLLPPIHSLLLPQCPHMLSHSETSHSHSLCSSRMASMSCSEQACITQWCGRGSSYSVERTYVLTGIEQTHTVYIKQGELVRHFNCRGLCQSQS